MTALEVSICCGIAFVILSLLTIFLQIRKMQNFERQPFEDGVFKGILPIMFCGAFSMFSAIGGAIALLFHFFN
jgi:hypothetical protein